MRVEVENQESVCFIAAGDLEKATAILEGQLTFRYTPVELRCFSEEERGVVACYFKTQRDLGFARTLFQQHELRCFEADIRPTDRYLMERFIQGSVCVTGEGVEESGYVSFTSPRLTRSSYLPALSVVSLDIETSISDKTILSIGVHGADFDKVMMVGEPQATELEYLEFVNTEKALLQRFLTWFGEIDPDVVIGWSVVSFDLRYLQDRCDVHGIELTIGRGESKVGWRVVEQGLERMFAVVPGRVVLDGIELLRTATYRFESFSLENVARELLGRGKLVEDVDARAFEIEQLYREDKDSLARYNLEDCVLVAEIFERTGLVEFAVQRACLTGLELDRLGGSVAAFDYLYLPRLHRSGFIAPVVDDDSVSSSPGGYVLESVPGIYSNVIVLDFKSLYPSIIRTFHVDPIAMIADGDDRIPGFKGASFARDGALLPQIIEELWQARDVAKSEGNTAVSQAIKIIMNSFYGVLGTPGCRFFDARLVSSITMRGHEILQKTRDLIEEQGYKVIYGDTDSVFVLADGASQGVQQAGIELVEYLNNWWRDDLQKRMSIESYLEIEFETHFEKFFMPKVRGSEKGSKKRYAGLVRDKKGGIDVVFKGLESVRSDWSPLAREFQQELYRRVFLEEPVEAYVKEVVESVQSGSSDEKLTLRRRLRRRLSDYKKNVPPHVRAARMADAEREKKGLQPTYERGGWIEYVMTIAGPEPKAYAHSRLDYDFYIDRQLAPIADAILSFRNTSLAELTDQQLGLF